MSSALMLHSYPYGALSTWSPSELFGMVKGIEKFCFGEPLCLVLCGCVLGTFVEN